MEYQSAIKDKILSFAPTQMKLEGIMLSKQVIHKNDDFTLYGK